jgi:hypothetical protein
LISAHERILPRIWQARRPPTAIPLASIFAKPARDYSQGKMDTLSAGIDRQDVGAKESTGYRRTAF